MDEGINVSTNLRHHWIEDLARIPTIVIPMALLFDLSPRSGGAAGMVFAGWTYFFHSNLRLHLGRFSWVLNAPQTHRIHHSRLSEHYDKNFAAFFPIWDVIFGTYFHPRRGEFPPTGVPDEPPVSNVWDAAALPFRTWRR
jgi:sterol desaturase/sphingolipid hydroxylase (fatty acid hydroxylase superfamily)